MKPKKKVITGQSRSYSLDRGYNQACDDWEKWHKEVTAELLGALNNLLEACEYADSCEELPEQVDGSLLDKANEAIAKEKG